MKVSRWICAAALSFSASALMADEADYKVLADKIPAAYEGKVDFVKDIQPIIEESCINCHSGRRPKSRYSMETREDAIKGGSSDTKAIVEKKSDKSPLIYFAADAVDDDELWMPPTSKREKYPKLKEEQVAKVRAWIDQGAKWPEDIVLKEIEK